MSDAVRETRSICCFCGTGCGVVLTSQGGRLTGVRGDPEHPANRGALCSKGRALHEIVQLPDRLLVPLARPAKGAALERISWDAATDRIARALRHALDTRGPDAVGFYLSGQLTTEDYYAFNKLAKGFLGVNHVDSNSRLCMSSAVSAYQRAFGVDGPPCCYEDLEASDLVVVVGANPAWCHPVLFQRLLAARERRAGRPALVVLDPRRTASAECADLHVPLAPGSDAIFLTALLAELARRGRLDRAWMHAHTENFEALEAVLPDFAAERVERECRVPRRSLEQVADFWCASGSVLSLWSMGVNQSAHGCDTAAAILNLQLATAQIGRPGAGPFSLTGQPNAMGGRETGALATLLPGHRRFESESDRRSLELLWRSAPISAQPGRTAVELFQHAAEGGCELLWIAATNPAATLPDLALVRRALERTPLVVLQDVVASTDTAHFADLLLPAAGFAEKSGTMTNSERRVSRLRAAVPAPGEARPDWQIVARVAARLGYEKDFAWHSDTDVWREHIATTSGRDCDMSGITPERLEAGPLQWPCPTADAAGAPRLYSDGRFPTPSGRARFVVPRGLRPAESCSAAFPLVLTSGRLRDQWHTMTRTGRVPRLLEHASQAQLEISAIDAEPLGVRDGDLVRVSSPRGAFEMLAAIEPGMPAGVVFAPIHWSRATGAEFLVNDVTHAALDPISRQPELKHAAVRVERVAAASRSQLATARDRGLCACHSVPAARVRAAIAAGARSVEAVGRECAAGTGCGSCRPEIAAMLRRVDGAACAEHRAAAKRGAQRAPGCERERIAVIGNGMVGHRFVAELVERDLEGRFQITVLCEEPRPAYDRVHLTQLFSGRSPEELALARPEAYAEWGVELRVGEAARRIDRERREIETSRGARIRYDRLVLATGSAPFVPPVPGTTRPGVFVYRTIEDLDAIRSYAAGVRRAAVIGGGLLGLEAAKALLDLGLETHVVEATPRLMVRQLDRAGAAALQRRIEALGVRVHLERKLVELRGGESTQNAEDGSLRAPDDPAFADLASEAAVEALRYADGSELPVELVVISAGIRPRDELARACGLACAERGGVAVDDELRSSDPRVFALGEVASHRGSVYGLVAPGFAMAETLAENLCAVPGTAPQRFAGADLSSVLKLLGVDVASFGDPLAEGSELRALVLHDTASDAYTKLVLSPCGTRLAGGILVGDTSQYGRLLQLARSGDAIPERGEALLFGARDPAANSSGAGASADALICSCNGVSRGALEHAIRDGKLSELAALKRMTRAGTGCGGCLPSVGAILAAELGARGEASVAVLCEHFAYSRQELFQIVKIAALRSFGALLASHGRGAGCEICKPAVASILASLWNDSVPEQPTIQDTNDRFLANIQRGGSYSIVPRVPGGEITPRKLVALGEIAEKYGLYCKITGGQRIDLLGARMQQLPEIWEQLVAQGFESGHAYGKAMRTVKSCVGTTWCRYGVQDSTGLAIRIEERYKGLRAPHKLKAAVSGCIRECAEAQSKDFGVIATEQGWNLYVCGNGGAKPRHAELLASDLDEATLFRFIDRFLMYYIETADRLTRTARWLESLPGGIDYLRKVVVDDHLGIGAELEARAQQLVDRFECEWARVVRDPALRSQFRSFANSDAADESLPFVEEREQERPAEWPLAGAATPRSPVVPDVGAARWIPLASAEEIPRDGGIAVRYGDAQLALFHVAASDSYYATQNHCPHRGDAVLARGIVGDERGVPKIACPQHKKTFDLASGRGLSDPELCVAVYPVRVEDGKLYVELPAASEIATVSGCEMRSPQH